MTLSWRLPADDDPRAPNPNLDQDALNFDQIVRATPIQPGSSLPSMVYSLSLGRLTLNKPGVYVFNIQGTGGDFRSATNNPFCEIRMVKVNANATLTFLEANEGAISLTAHGSAEEFFSGQFTLQVGEGQTPYVVQPYLAPTQQNGTFCEIDDARMTIWRFQ